MHDARKGFRDQTENAQAGEWASVGRGPMQSTSTWLDLASTKSGLGHAWARQIDPHPPTPTYTKAAARHNGVGRVRHQDHVIEWNLRTEPFPFIYAVVGDTLTFNFTAFGGHNVFLSPGGLTWPESCSVPFAPENLVGFMGPLTVELNTLGPQTRTTDGGVKYSGHHDGPRRRDPRVTHTPASPPDPSTSFPFAPTPTLTLEVVGPKSFDVFRSNSNLQGMFDTSWIHSESMCTGQLIYSMKNNKPVPVNPSISGTWRVVLPEGVSLANPYSWGYYTSSGGGTTEGYFISNIGTYMAPSGQQGDVASSALALTLQCDLTYGSTTETQVSGCMIRNT
eukprot:gene14526-20557_t